MLCVTLRALTRICSNVSGGISRIWIFDGEDFDWTQASYSTTTGYQPYTAVARRSGATAAGGALMFPIGFQEKEANYQYAQTRKGASVKYEHTINFQLPDLSQLIANWNISVDAAGSCCGIGLAIQLNTGKILIAGEKWVNAAAIDIPLKMVQDGSSGDTGKLFDDANAHNAVIKGDYWRPLFEFTGGATALIALQS